jgi:hypothetical protein
MVGQAATSDYMLALFMGAIPQVSASDSPMRSIGLIR